MGLPAFYSWLVGKYPKVVEHVIEEKDSVDSSQPNPNGKEFDNLYLDINGIIHSCFYPEDQINGPTNYDAVFSLIFEYIDRLFNIVRPRKLLYMAMDGVTPRAKMNQQRTRRFWKARDTEIAEAEEARLRKEFSKNGKEVLPKVESEVSDSNVISPGTVFMHKLAIALENYICNRITNDHGWKSVKVILSDSNVPGEGEHKIISYIRLQKSSPGYNPKTCHCLYGLDADLIMLALATREINIYILREDILKHAHDNVSNAVSEVCAKLSKTGIHTIKSGQLFPEVSSVIYNKPYRFVNIRTLREYLKVDMQIKDAKFEIDLERIVDDFIFICFFTGNDFLPRLPTLSIYEGALDLLIHVYKKRFSTNGYLIDTSRINEKNDACMKIKRVEKFIIEVGTYEEKIFQKRYDMKQAMIQRSIKEAEKEKCEIDDIDKPDDREYIDFNCNNPIKNLAVSCATTAISEEEKISNAIANTHTLKKQLNCVILSNNDLYKSGIFDNDKVKLGCDGWKARYYKEKFSANNETEVECKRKEVVEKYMEGICWILQYYFLDVCSWSWYYPFYYGPFASDLKGLSCPTSPFKYGEPFKPFNQLMAILPPRSSNALPKAYMNLMKSEDSPLVEFYPKDIEVDTDEKRFVWQGVCKLPFIDEEKLLAATKNIEKDLEKDEVTRNSVGTDRIFVRDSSGLVQSRLHDVDTFSSSCIVNPDQHLHIPRPIVTDDSQIHQMKITEDDIVERCLWHEHNKLYHPVSVKNSLENFRGRGRNDREGSSSVRHKNRWRDDGAADRSSNWRSDCSSNKRYMNSAYINNRYSSERDSGNRW